jgi:hypothetical protein
MRVMLDQESWEVSGETPLAEVLDELVQRARGRQRIVTHLSIGGAAISDRDLHPALLAQTLTSVGPVEASTRTIPETISDGQPSATRYAETLREEALHLSGRLRAGEPALPELDRWLGGLADYVEFLALGGEIVAAAAQRNSLIASVSELLHARDQGDPVRLADLLEYELAPKLGV